MPFYSNMIAHIFSFLNILILTIGDHIDISRGPMIASTSLVGRCLLTAVSMNFFIVLDSQNSECLTTLNFII